MKNSIYIVILLILIIGCDSTQKVVSNTNESQTKISDTVRIANEELKYEVIIIDSGFSSWLASKAQPRGYYSESYLENRNRIYVSEWNRRAMQPLSYNPSLYEMQINYDYTTHYGYEVNYLIYNYLVFFQIKNNQKLAGFVPRP